MEFFVRVCCRLKEGGHFQISFDNLKNCIMDVLKRLVTLLNNCKSFSAKCFYNPLTQR